jgi:hypothetical protein
VTYWRRPPLLARLRGRSDALPNPVLAKNNQRRKNSRLARVATMGDRLLENGPPNVHRDSTFSRKDRFAISDLHSHEIFHRDGD